MEDTAHTLPHPPPLVTFDERESVGEMKPVVYEIEPITFDRSTIVVPDDAESVSFDKSWGYSVQSGQPRPLPSISPPDVKKVSPSEESNATKHVKNALSWPLADEMVWYVSDTSASETGVSDIGQPVAESVFSDGALSAESPRSVCSNDSTLSMSESLNRLHSLTVDMGPATRLNGSKPTCTENLPALSLVNVSPASEPHIRDQSRSLPPRSKSALQAKSPVEVVSSSTQSLHVSSNFHPKPPPVPKSSQSSQSQIQFPRPKSRRISRSHTQAPPGPPSTRPKPPPARSNPRHRESRNSQLVSYSPQSKPRSLSRGSKPQSFSHYVRPPRPPPRQASPGSQARRLRMDTQPTSISPRHRQPLASAQQSPHRESFQKPTHRNARSIVEPKRLSSELVDKIRTGLSGDDHDVPTGPSSRRSLSAPVSFFAEKSRPPRPVSRPPRPVSRPPRDPVSTPPPKPLLRPRVRSRRLPTRKPFSVPSTQDNSRASSPSAKSSDSGMNATSKITVELEFVRTQTDALAQIGSRGNTIKSLGKLNLIGNSIMVHMLDTLTVSTLSKEEEKSEKEKETNRALVDSAVSATGALLESYRALLQKMEGTESVQSKRTDLAVRTDLTSVGQEGSAESPSRRSARRIATSTMTIVRQRSNDIVGKVRQAFRTGQTKQ
eukprot:163475_1